MRVFPLSTSRRLRALQDSLPLLVVQLPVPLHPCRPTLCILGGFVLEHGGNVLVEANACIDVDRGRLRIEQVAHPDPVGGHADAVQIVSSWGVEPGPT